MLDKATFCCCWKQVELNTIASGFGWMGPASGMIHRLVSCLVPQQKYYFPNNTIAFKMYIKLIFLSRGSNTFNSTISLVNRNVFSEYLVLFIRGIFQLNCS